MEIGRHGNTTGRASLEPQESVDRFQDQISCAQAFLSRLPHQERGLVTAMVARRKNALERVQREDKMIGGVPPITAFNKGPSIEASLLGEVLDERYGPSWRGKDASARIIKTTSSCIKGEEGSTQLHPKYPIHDERVVGTMASVRTMIKGKSIIARFTTAQDFGPVVEVVSIVDENTGRTILRNHGTIIGETLQAVQEAAKGIRGMGIEDWT